MHNYKGFSLIELMIVVAIIAILSLMAIPMYQDYVTKVKLTEVITQHLHLNRQLEIEYKIGGGDGLFSFLNASCVADYQEQIPNNEFTCTTNIGIFPNSEMTVYRSWGGVMTIIYSPGYISNDKNQTISYQTLFIHDYAGDVLKSSVTYKPANGDWEWKDPTIPWFPSLTGRLTYQFSFRQNHRDDITKNILLIEDKDGNTSPGGVNRWYCASAIENGRRIDYNTPISIMPRSIRPIICPYTSINRSSETEGRLAVTFVEM